MFNVLLMINPYGMAIVH